MKNKTNRLYDGLRRDITGIKTIEGNKRFSNIDNFGISSGFPYITDVDTGSSIFHIGIT